MIVKYLVSRKRAARKFVTFAATTRPPDKSAYWKSIFFISHPKHMLWVLKTLVKIDE